MNQYKPGLKPVPRKEPVLGPGAHDFRDNVSDFWEWVREPPRLGIFVFAVGLIPVWLLSIAGISLEYFGIDRLIDLQGNQVGFGLLQVGGGLLIGFLLVAIVHFLRRRRDVGLALLSLVAAFLLLRPGLGEWAGSFGMGIGFLVGIVIAWQRFFPSRHRPPTTFGSAQWATEGEIAARGMFDSGGFRLGGYMRAVPGSKKEKRQAVLRYKGDRHLLTIAPTGGGKGRSVIVPNLLTYTGSVLCIDPKGENALITAYARAAELGQRILLIDPWDLVAHRFGMTPARFNPLTMLKDGDRDLAKKAMAIAEAFVIRGTGGGADHGGGNAGFFDEESKSMLGPLCAYVAIDEREEGNRTLGRVRELLSLKTEDLLLLFAYMGTSKNAYVRTGGNRAMQKHSELLSNVMASAQAHTHVLDSPAIQESLSGTDVDFADLGRADITIYIIIPFENIDETHARWLRLLISQAITANSRSIEQAPKRKILFMLDEMAVLGRLDAVKKAFAYMRGYGMQIWGIIQDLSQLEELYGKGWQSIIANCGVLQYFGSRDEMTAGYFSKLVGMATVQDSGFSFARAFSSGGTGGGSSSTTQTWNYSDKQRSLAFADELMRLKDSEQLLLVENMNPIAAAKVLWDKDAELSAKGYNLHQARLAAANDDTPRAAAAE